MFRCANPLPRLLFLLLFAFMTRSASAGIIYLVQPGGPFPTIQSGIDAASHFDTVVVVDGRWIGAGNTELDLKGKRITVRSQSGNPEDCYIDCRGSGRGVRFSGGEGPGTVFEGIGIKYGDAFSGGAIKIESGCNPTLRNLRLKYNSASQGGAIMIEDGAGATIEDSRIASNDATSSGGGIYVFGGSLLIRDSDIVNNDAPYGGGIRILDAAETVDIENCLFQLNDASINGGGLHVNQSNAVVRDTTFHFNHATEDGGGLIVAHDAAASLHYCTFLENTAELEGGAARATSFGQIILFGCHFEDNEAISERGGAVFVEDGSYVITYDACTFHKNSSGWGGGAIASLDGYTYLSDSSFTNNSAGTNGGAVRLRGDHDGRMTECSFSENSATNGGALAVRAADAYLDRCSFIDNEATDSGGAMHLFNAYSMGCRTLFESNDAPDGSALRLASESFARLDNCRFLSNEGGPCIGIFGASEGRFANPLIAQNMSTSPGGGVYVSEGSNLSLDHATVVRNHTDGASGGGVFCEGVAGISSCVFWENDAAGSMNSDAQIRDLHDTVFINNSCIQNLDATRYGHAIDSTSDDPLFVDPAAGNFRVMAGSPAIDTGNPWLYDVCDLDDDEREDEDLSLDLDDTDRWKGAAMDMGAYEWSATGDVTGDGIVNAADLAAVLNAWGPNEGDPADLNGDGVVGAADLALVLDSWTE